MFAFEAGRDLIIAIVITAILVAAMDRMQRREARDTPTIYYGVAISPAPHGSGADCRAASLDECRAAFYSAERR